MYNSRFNSQETEIPNNSNLIRLKPVVLDLELDQKRRKIDELSTRKLFDRRELEKYKIANASSLIPNIVYPLK